VGGRFGVREILESIIEPSKVISDQYGTVVVTLKDGTAYVGRLAGENPEIVQIQENLFAPSDVRAISRKDIKKMEASPVSLMPPALIDTCQPEDTADLVSYLINGGKASVKK
jgi:putative heme-binding domain-containing protein